MAFFKLILTAGLVSLAMADVSEIVGKNQYLPPSKGYNYDRPSIPFPSAPAPRPTPTYQTSFPARPTPTYQTSFPARPTPTYQTSFPGRPTPNYQTSFPTRPTYQPPAPSYVPPVSSPRPTIARPTPTYRPIPSPGYQPGTAPSGNQGNFIGPTGGGGDHDHHHHHEPGMPYDFEYKVKDDQFGNDYYRNEVSDGDVIKGEYRVQLPDGRLQIVKYTADWKNGYNADVSYQGQPTYPGGSGAGLFPSGGSQYPSGAGQSPNAYIPPSRF